jgi:hypothetical protein
LSELVSEPKFPASWEYTRNFVRGSPPRPATGLNSGNNINALEGNSLRIRTGNLIRSNRELNRPIREIFTLIKESRAGPAISLRCNHFHNKRGYRKVQSSVTCPEGICSLADLSSVIEGRLEASDRRAGHRQLLGGNWTADHKAAVWRIMTHGSPRCCRQRSRSRRLCRLPGALKRPID